MHIHQPVSTIQGMINVCPIGRNCSQAERDDFAKYDAEHKVRESFVAALQQRFPDFGLKFSIGGQISIDIFPIGWDKTYCLRFLTDHFDAIHFFGDRTEPVSDHDYLCIYNQVCVFRAAMTMKSMCIHQLLDMLSNRLSTRKK